MIVKTSYPMDGVCHLQFESRKELIDTFIRVQEFYESAFDNIRGKYFSLGDFLEQYENKYHTDYYEDWNGFNVPGEIVRKFFDLFKDDVRSEESVIPRDCQYVIGTWDEDSIDHELAHALYHIDADYRGDMNYMIFKMDLSKYKIICNWLIDTKGYNTEVVFDEIQAYLATSEYDYLDGHGLGSLHDLVKPFRDNFNTVVAIHKT